MVRLPACQWRRRTLGAAPLILMTGGSGGPSLLNNTPVRNIGTNFFTSSVLTPGGGTFPE